jgi:hypothetical protein
MPIADIFSKRGKALPSSDVFTYDSLPQALRIQIVHIWTSTLGPPTDGRHISDWEVYEVPWREIVTGLAREHGRLNLATGHRSEEQAFNFLVNMTPPVKEHLDLVEATFRVVDSFYRNNLWRYQRCGSVQDPDDAIHELNHRFLEHGVGYRYENRRVIRIDSTFTHAEILKPVLRLLRDKRFKNAETEFMAAHLAYREHRHSDCLNETLKAFESTMKIICTDRKWKFDANDTASKLIGVVLDNGLIAKSFQTQLTSLRQLLESGTPMVRNKNSGHGQGAASVEIPDYIARYALNTAAANITLLIEAFGSKR